MNARSKAEIARDTRWKLPSLNRLGFAEMWSEIEKIQSELYEMRYFVEDGDETFMNAMDGDSEEEWEFRMAFSELEGEADEIAESFQNWDNNFVYLMTSKERAEMAENGIDYTSCRLYDDCTVALMSGKRKFNFGVMGYDTEESDFFGLDDGESEAAARQAEKRLLRLTKEKLVDTVGQAVSIMLKFYEFLLRYQLMTQTFEQIRGANLSILKLMKDIDAEYEIIAAEMAENKRIGLFNPRTMYSKKAMNAERRFDSLIENLPDHCWVE